MMSNDLYLDILDRIALAESAEQLDLLREQVKRDHPREPTLPDLLFLISMERSQMGSVVLRS